MEKRCSECLNAETKDYGYSDWTVEGTSVFCMLSLHPDDGFDRWYKITPDDAYAEVCPEFKPGGPSDEHSVGCYCQGDTCKYPT